MLNNNAFNNNNNFFSSKVISIKIDEKTVANEPYELYFNQVNKNFLIIKNPNLNKRTHGYITETYLVGEELITGNADKVFRYWLSL